MHLGRPFRNVTGILAGSPVHVSPSDLERIWSQFDAETSERGHDVARPDAGNRRRGSGASEAGERRRGAPDRRRPS
jgi:hypothetical protein